MIRIDAHHHLWHYSAEEYSWIDENMKQLRRDFLLADLRSQLEAAKVNGTVAVQARQTVEETRFLLQLAEIESALLGVVGWLPLMDPAFESRLPSFLPLRKLKGLRHVVQAEPAGFLDREDFNRGMRTLTSSGLMFDLLLYSPQLEEATRFVDRHPTQVFVLDHMAKPEIRHGEFTLWNASIRELARRPNVHCKVSGLVTEADWANWTPHQLRPYFDTVMEAFGPTRLMIGTDWPVLTLGCTYTQWWHTVEEWIASLSLTEQEQVVGATAMRVYGLEL